MRSGDDVRVDYANPDDERMVEAMDWLAEDPDRRRLMLGPMGLDGVCTGFAFEEAA